MKPALEKSTSKEGKPTTSAMSELPENDNLTHHTDLELTPQSIQWLGAQWLKQWQVKSLSDKRSMELAVLAVARASKMPHRWGNTPHEHEARAIVALREFLKALAEDDYEEPLVHALETAVAAVRDKAKHHSVITRDKKAIQRLLTPSRKADDPGKYLDPREWNRPLNISDAPEGFDYPMARFGFLIAELVQQDLGAEDAGVTPLDATLLACKKRANKEEQEEGIVRSDEDHAEHGVVTPHSKPDAQPVLEPQAQAEATPD